MCTINIIYQIISIPEGETQQKTKDKPRSDVREKKSNHALSVSVSANVVLFVLLVVTSSAVWVLLKRVKLLEEQKKEVNKDTQIHQYENDYDVINETMN